MKTNMAVARPAILAFTSLFVFLAALAAAEPTVVDAPAPAEPAAVGAPAPTPQATGATVDDTLPKDDPAKALPSESLSQENASPSPPVASPPVVEAKAMNVAKGGGVNAVNIPPIPPIPPYKPMAAAPPKVVDVVPGIEASVPKPTSDELYSKDRTTPTKATSLSGDDIDIDASVRERIEEDSKRVGKIAENLVGVQGDINKVEKEVLGKVFDMSSMKSFLNAHETAIKDHEKLDQEQDDLTKQATSLSKQLDKAINETSTQDKAHRAAMAQLSSQVAEDKSVIQGLQKELVPLVEMQKEVEKMPPVNANLTAENTQAVAAAESATEELVYEKSKLKTYQDTTKNLMKELVKQHDYATKCHERLYQLNTQIHDISSKEAAMKYEQGRTASKGEAMEKFLEEKNALIEKRMKKSKTNLQTISFAKGNTKAKIAALQAEGQLQLEKLKAELGKLRMQAASIETAMMAKISNRKLIEKALRGANLQVTDMQARLLAGRLDKLRRNNTQMTGDLAQIRAGLQKAQIATAKAESQRTQLLAQAVQMKEQAANKTTEVQQVAREALNQVMAAKESADEAAQKAQQATMEAQASMLVQCSAIWDKEHKHVNTKLKQCKQVKQDLATVKASVATLTSTVQSAKAAGLG